MKNLSREEIGNLGLYEFQGYIGSMTSPTFGGWQGTERLIDLLDIKEMKKPKILEVGCSTGYITRYVAQKFDCEIIGVDLSTLLLYIAEEQASKLKLNNISFKYANVENLPFSDNTCFGFRSPQGSQGVSSSPKTGWQNCHVGLIHEGIPQ
jgi:SAM-dependent methyltransferase